jgi:hypothetical protein
MAFEYLASLYPFYTFQLYSNPIDDFDIILAIYCHDKKIYEDFSFMDTYSEGGGGNLFMIIGQHPTLNDTFHIRDDQIELNIPITNDVKKEFLNNFYKRNDLRFTFFQQWKKKRACYSVHFPKEITFLLSKLIRPHFQILVSKMDDYHVIFNIYCNGDKIISFKNRRLFQISFDIIAINRCWLYLSDPDLYFKQKHYPYPYLSREKYFVEEIQPDQNSGIQIREKDGYFNVRISIFQNKDAYVELTRDDFISFINSFVIASRYFTHTM